MPWCLKRYQSGKQLHFVTFSCYKRQPLLNSAHARSIFELTLERVRRRYRFFITGYVIMPEHVHLLVSEPEEGTLATAIQVLKQLVARKLGHGGPFWLPRYYDFNVWTEEKKIEKLKYIHRNPVARGLAERAEDWAWSSFLHYATGQVGSVDIESQWAANRRERSGEHLQAVLRKSTNPPFAKEAKDGAPQSETKA